MQDVRLDGTKNCVFRWSKFLKLSLITTPITGIFKVWTTYAKIYSKWQMTLLPATPSLKIWWIINTTIFTLAALMDLRSKFTNLCAFYKEKDLSFTTIFEQKRYKESIFCFLGRLHFGERCVETSVGFYGMVLCLGDGIGGLGQPYGFWKCYSRSYWRWTSNRSWNVFRICIRLCLAILWTSWHNTVSIRLE